MSKFACTIQRDDLSRALGLVGSVIERSNKIIPILACVRMETQEGRLQLMTTDLDRAAMSREICVSSGDIGGAAMPPYAQFAGVVAALPAGEIVLEEKGGYLTLVQGRARYRFPSLPAEDWPNITTTHKTFLRFDLPGQSLAGSLKAAFVHASREETRFFLNGVSVQAHDDTTLKFVATDCHRLGRFLLECERAGEVPADTIIPYRSVQNIITLIGDHAIDVGMILHIGDKRAQGIEISIPGPAGEDTFFTKLIDGAFPETDRIIPWGAEHSVRFQTADLLSAIRRIGLVARDDKEKSTHVVLQTGPDGIEVSGGLVAGAEGVECISAADGAHSGKLTFAKDYVAQVLDSLRADTVDMIWGDDTSGAVIFVPAEELFGKNMRKLAVVCQIVKKPGGARQ